MMILFVSNGYPPREKAGTELYTYNIAHALSDGNEIKVFCRTVDRGRKEHDLIRERVEGTEVVRVVNNLSGALKPARYYSDVDTDRIFERYLDEARPEVVHVQHLMGLSAGIIALVKRAGIPLVVTLHDYWFLCPRFQLVDEAGNLCTGPEGGDRCARLCPNSLFSLPGSLAGTAGLFLRFMPGGLQKRLKEMVRSGKVSAAGGGGPEKFRERASFLREALEQADMVISPSAYVKDVFVKNGLVPEKIRVIPNGILKPVPEPKKPHGKTRFAYLGSFAPLKGVPFLIEAFGKAGVDAELHIYGHGGENDSIISGELAGMAAGKPVFFHGPYEFGEIGRIMSETDMLVIPSLWPETFSIVMREAFSCGVPVLAAAAGALTEGVEDGVNGLLFERADVGGLAERMRMAVEEPGLLDGLRLSIGPVKDMAAHALEMDALYEGNINRHVKR